VIEQKAIHQPAQAEQNRCQPHGGEDDAARNIDGMNDVECAGQKQARGKTGLQAPLLLTQYAVQLGR